MQSVNITTSEENDCLRMNIQFLKVMVELQFRISNNEVITLDETEDILIQEESREEMKRRKSRDYYAANKDRLCEASRNRYRDKKRAVLVVEEEEDISDNLSEISEEESLIFDYDPSIIPAAASIDSIPTYNEVYYQNHLTETRRYYQDNKDRIAKRQQTDESRAKFREQYHLRREKLTPAQIASKNAKASAQRKVRELKLKAKYPDCRTLKAAKAAAKASREVV